MNFSRLATSSGLALASLSLLIGGASNASAQIGGSFSASSSTMMHMSFPASPSSLVVNRPDVQEELNLTSDQKDAIKSTEKTNALKFLGNDGLEWTQLSKILTPKQRDRAIQLAFQASGVVASLTPGLSDRLHLTPTQQKKLAEIEHGYLLGEDKDLMEAQNGDAPQSPDEARAARALRQDLFVRSVAAVLSPAQQKALKELGGAPFKFESPAPKPVGLWMHAMGMSG